MSYIPVTLRFLQLARTQPMRTTPLLLALSAILGGLVEAADLNTTHHEAPMHNCCPIVELRQYTLHPGKRDELISLFEDEFIESQEATGMRVAAQFRDAGDPDRFVWVRGFESMETRKAALTSFYTGPVWQAHRNQANATMVDSDNVLLLRPAFPGSGLALEGQRPAKGTAPAQGKTMAASIHYFSSETSPAAIEDFARRLTAMSVEAGARVLAQYVSEKSPNTFPRLPVREHDNVLVCFAAFDSPAAYQRWREALGRPRDAAPQLRPPELLSLQATARSLVR